MQPTQNKDLNRLLRKLLESGWQMDCSGRHIKLTCPQSCWPCVMVSKTPSDSRTIENFKAKVRRAMRESVQEAGA